MLKLTCLLPYPYDTAPGQRFRLEQWADVLPEFGVELRLDHLLDEVSVLRSLQGNRPSPAAIGQLLARSATRLRGLMRESAPDAYVVHREASLVGPPLIEYVLARRAPMILDLDDAIWGLPDDFNPWAPRNIVRMPSKTRGVMKRCAGISAGNQYLADFSATLCPDVEVVPTTIDTENAYRSTKQHRDGEKLVVGWSGSHSTGRYIYGLLPSLAEIAKDLPMRLLVIGAEVSHPGLEITCKPWRAATEVEDLLEMDVGLMPLEEDMWSRGKCGLKALQYMALGIPAIVSPIGVNTEIVDHGRNGFLAGSAADWCSALQATVSTAARSRLGAAARATVEAKYSTRVAAEKFASLAHRVVARSRPRGTPAGTSAV